MALRWGAVGAIAAFMAVSSGTHAQYARQGAIVYTQSFTRQVLPCSGHPIILSGSHTAITMRGACSYVRVAGEHNDITIPIVASGVIEISGQHNDVTWRQVSPGPRPHLRTLAPHNDFHPPT